MKILRIGASALLAAWLAASVADAQTVVPDPFQPGAAAAEETPAPEAKPAPNKPALARRATPRKRPAPAGLAVTIANKRSVGLVELDVGPTGGEVKKVQGALAFGRKAVVHLPRAKDCLYDIKGHYADEADTDLTGVNLCKDKTINLTDE
jgi:hypothetical protein